MAQLKKQLAERPRSLRNGGITCARNKSRLTLIRAALKNPRQKQVLVDKSSPNETMFF
jgi:hypothetical protein